MGTGLGTRTCMRVLVTGASGKLGRQLVGLLSARGYDVRGIDIAASALGGVEG